MRVPCIMQHTATHCNTLQHTCVLQGVGRILHLCVADVAGCCSVLCLSCMKQFIHVCDVRKTDKFNISRKSALCPVFMCTNIVIRAYVYILCVHVYMHTRAHKHTHFYIHPPPISLSLSLSLSGSFFLSRSLSRSLACTECLSFARSPTYTLTCVSICLYVCAYVCAYVPFCVCVCVCVCSRVCRRGGCVY